MHGADNQMLLISKLPFFRTLLGNFAQRLLQFAQIAAGYEFVHFAGVIGNRAVAGAPTLRLLGVKPDHRAAQPSDLTQQIGAGGFAVVAPVAQDYHQRRASEQMPRGY